jgi:outer membrane autotransporter protein
MTRSLRTTTALAALFPLALAGSNAAGAQELSELLATFGVLGASTVTNTVVLDDVTTVNGNVGVWSGLAITNFPPGEVVAPYTLYPGSVEAQQAQSDLTVAFTSLQNRQVTNDMTGQDLGGKTLIAGVYGFDTDAQLTGQLTLDGQGNPNSVFIIQVGSQLTTASNSSILLIGGAQGANVYFVVGSSAVIGTDTAFIGQILALASITLNTDANLLCGAALARTGQVSLDSNTISICTLQAATYGEVLDGVDTTPNQDSVADSLDDFVDGGGELPPAFQDLIDFLSPQELADVFTQLSGELGTAVAPAGIQSMNAFLSLALNSWGNGDRRGPGIVTAPARDTVKVLGYADERRPLSDAAVASAALGDGLPDHQWDVWGAVFGVQSFTDGDAGTHGRTARSYGIASGFDTWVTPDTRFGIAFSGGGTDFSLADDLGNGHSDVLQGAVHIRKNVNNAYLAGAFAYAFNDTNTDRTITVPGIGLLPPTTEQLSANFAGHDFAVQVEAGYHIGWLTPYAALRGQLFYVPAYQETADGGGSSDFGLAYADNTTSVIRTEIGSRVDHTIAMHAGTTLGLHGRIAWAHDFWSGTDANASFTSIAAPSFIVKGAAPAADSLLVSAGAEIGLSQGLSLAAWFDGEFSEGSQTYAGTGRVRYAW